MLTDVHTHSAFSADGVSSLAEMIERAHALHIAYYGVSDHFDYDYRALKLKIDGKEIPYIRAEEYFSAARALQAQYATKLRVLVGAEFGFSPLPRVAREYEEVIAAHRPDFVVNSVHTVGNTDCWFPAYFAGKSKQDAYARYLDAVRASLDAPYHYDIVAHLGYVARNAPYPDPKLRYEDFAPALDDILKTVVARDKILEVNSSARTAGSSFLPDRDILARYFALGGRKVSFASDAHDTGRILARREEVVAALKELGFTHITVPDGAVHRAIPL